MTVRKYVEMHGFNGEYIDKLRNLTINKSFHIFGATGALGKSLLRLIKEEIIKPNSVHIYLRQASNFSDWVDVCKRLNIQCDIFSLNSLDYLRANPEGSVVVYFLGSAQPAVFLNDPLGVYRCNINLLMDVLDCAPEILLYASSSELYTGITKECNEETLLQSTPQHPRSAYIESKRCGESILVNIRSEKTKAISFRIALATPPNNLSGDKRVLSELVEKGLNGQPIQLMGGHNSIRQYQWGPLAVLKILYAGFFGSYNLYNISGGEKLTLAEISKLIAQKLGVPYLEKKEISDCVIGAPDCVDISDKRFQKEFNFNLKSEKFKNLLDVYLNDK